MVQKQLVDYIKSQFDLGIQRDVVKSALLEAGWNVDDIEDSLKEIGGGQEAIGTTKGVDQNIIKEVGAVAEILSNKSNVSPPIVVSDLVGSTKADILSGLIALDKSAGKADDKNKMANKAIKEKRSLQMPRFGAQTAAIALAVLAALFAVAGVYLYLQNKTLRGEAGVSSVASDTLSAKISDLNSQVSDLTGKNSDFSSQVSSLTSGNQEMATELSFVGIPVGASSTDSVSFTTPGTLGGGGKVQYNLTTKDGIKIYIANSADAKVGAALKPLLGQTAAISGTHALGSRDVAVTAVNGTDVSATATASSTTAQ